MKPTIGRIVHYTLTETDAADVNRRRKGSRDREGAWVHHGNQAEVGQQYPLLVTRTWGDGSSVNGQVFLDGNDTLWVTSRIEGDHPGTWSWPPRV